MEVKRNLPIFRATYFLIFILIIFITLIASVFKSNALGTSKIFGNINDNIERSVYKSTLISNFPIEEQPYKFACNVTAASIVLKYRGINVTPDDVFNSVPKDSTKKENGYWGNPDLGFVGNIYGEYGGTKEDGYGIHWKPVADYLSKYREVEIERDWNVKEMLDEIDKNNPSIAWMQNGVTPPNKMQWKSHDENGKEITVNAVWGMHSEIIIGYVGEKENPKQLIASDPWAERWNNQYHYIDIDDFQKLWAYYNQTAILVL